MNLSPKNLGRYARLSLLLLMLAAQGIAAAHEIGDSHALNSDLCATCIIGHGLATAVGANYAIPPQVCHVFTPVVAMNATLISRVNCHCARAPPSLSL